MKILFDLATNPDEIHNLADDPARHGSLEACRARLEILKAAACAH